jgi:hypothetical protein
VRLEVARAGLERLRKEVQEEGAIDATKAEQLALQLSEVDKRMDTSGEFNQGQWQAREKVTAKLPTSLFAKRIALSLRPEDLASVGKRQRLVLATNPTRMQRALNLDTRVLAQFETEQNLFASAAARQPKKQGEQMYYWGGQGLDKPYETPARILVVISSYSRGYYNVEVKLVNAKGKMFAQSNASVTGQDSAFMEKPEPVAQGEKAMEPDGDAKVLLEAMRPLMARGGEPEQGALQLPDDFKQKMLQPEKIDPFNLMGEWTLRKYAEAKGKNIVAVVHDSMVQVLMFFPLMGGLTPGRLEKGLGSANSVLTNTGNWAVITPKVRTEAYEDTMDRGVLGKMARRMASSDKITLEEWGDFAYRLGREPWDSIFSLYTMILQGRMGFNMNWNGLRVYGSLEPNQRQALQKGGKIMFGNMSQTQQKLFAELVYGVNGNLEITSTAQEVAAPVAVGDDEAVQTMEYMPGIDQEPTELLPNGIPSNSEFTMDFSARDVMFAVYNKGDGGWNQDPEPSEPSTVAWAMYCKERPDLFPWATRQPSIKEFANGRRTDITMHLKMTAKASVSFNVQDTDIPANGKRMKYDDLPADFKKKVDEQVAQYRESYKNSKPGEFGSPGGGRVIPPRN